MAGPYVDLALLIVSDGTFSVRFVSDEVPAQLGFTREDFLTSKVNLAHLMHPGDSEIAAPLFSKQIEPLSGDLLVRLRHANGRMRIFRAQFTKEQAPTEGCVNVHIRLVNVCNIVTAGDATLLSSFKSLISHTNDYIYIKNRNHVILAASRQLAKFTESIKDSAELAGKTDYDVHPEAIADVGYALEEQAFAEGRRINLIQELSDQAGKRYSIDNRKYPINGPDGEMIGIFGIAPDITRAIENERRLREGEALLQLFIEHAPVALAMFDREMRYLAVSRRWAEDHEVEPYEIVGRLHYEVNPEVTEKWKETHRRGLAGETQRVEEDRYLRADGTEEWIHWQITPWRREDGSVGGIVMFYEDITERKKTERRIRDSEESLNEAQRIAGLGVHVQDLSTGAWSASDVLREILGVEPEDDVSLPSLMALIHQEDRAGFEAQFTQEALRKAQRFDLEHRIVRKSDHDVRWVRAVGRVENDRVGNPAKLFGTVQDITERKRSEAQVRESEALLHLFVEHAPAALAMFDRDMRCLAVSHRWLEMYSLTAAQVIGKSHYDVFPDMPAHWRSAHKRALAGEAVVVEEDRFERADGSTQWIHWENIPWRNDAGSVGGIVIFVDDISESIENQKRLRLAASVFTHAREGITITDAMGTILDVNDSFTRITGYPREEVIGDNPRLLKSGLQGRDFYDRMWQSLRIEGSWSGEIWNRAKSGNIYAEHLTINAIRDVNGKVLQYVAHFSDITALKEHELQLERVTHYDSLTGLPNRVLLADRLRQAMSQAHRRGQQIAVAYLDIDGFKGINSQYGHTVGDTLLITLGLRFKAVLREGDTLARIGGDEFVAVMLDLDTPAAGETIIEGLLTAAAEQVTIDGQSMTVSASIGATFYPQSEEFDEDGLVRQADQAMYQAKLDGRNCYRRFDPGQDLTIRGRHEGREQIRRALAANEFVLYYQPKVSMRTGKVVGAEALIRWQHPERGLMSPASFLPIVEEHELAIAIGEWVIDNALAQMEIWQEQGMKVPVSVNVGSMQLQQPDFVDRLKELLAAHPRVAPAQLELEVIETSALNDVVQTSAVLNACHKLGVSVALDDFGTGYSSLAYLKRLPANVLKIDQSFVLEMFDDPENLAILEGVLGLASAFRLNVIAEGVETAEHGLVLLQLGCEFAQGYGIARPMPAEDFPRWAAHWHSDPSWAEVEPISSGKRQMLYAGVEHRAWVGAFEAFLRGKRMTPPTLDVHECRFGVWLDKEGNEEGSLNADIESIRRLHFEVHELAGEILATNAQDRSAALSRLPALHELRDRLLQQLDAYVGHEGWRQGR